MIPHPFKGLYEAGVLGMNNRNAGIIMAQNPRSRFPLVDNKVATKQLAALHNIPTPELYGVIKRHGDVRQFDSIIRDRNSFVVKPARGSGGSGIVLVKEKRMNDLITESGKTITIPDIRYHITDILSGIFSLEGQDDQAIIEALIHPDDVFAAVTYRGVPDIRVIVYRGVPIMAMVRLPTTSSDGKANLHGGAIGAGIDLGSGLTITAVHKSAIVTHHPDTGNPVSGIQVPYWEKTLLMAARSLEMTGLGYVGADVVMDRDRGPLLLELNARPGLAIQMANRAGLMKRIRHVNAAPAEIFATPEERMEWAQLNL
ncbi:MAG: alpha-L-glutamate ligase-like protein [Syntrophorhabdaceae bacterium]|nr:alpha-L-glutamate ligase-like protein [Syntrophorhabdaceae bacterium]